MVNSPDGVQTEDSAIILEIKCEGDADRASDLLEQTSFVVPVWIYHPEASVGSSVAWMKAGAAHVVSGTDELETAIGSHDENGHAECGHSGSSNMIGLSRGMREVQSAIRMVADRNCSVLIEGETGTGKEVVAREIHVTGSRSRGPWVAVNCSAIPEPLLEAELFGYLKGAFTGAQQSRTGKFEAANHGTIFWMRSPTCQSELRPNFCAFYRNEKLNGLAGMNGCAWTSA